MVISGIICLIIGLFGAARIITIPLGLILITVGIIWDVIALIGHGIALIF